MSGGRRQVQGRLGDEEGDLRGGERLRGGGGVIDVSEMLAVWMVGRGVGFLGPWGVGV